MKYEYIHRIEKNYSEQERTILDRAVALATNTTETTLLDSITVFLQEWTSVDYTLIGKIAGPDLIETLTFWGKGKKLENYTYSTLGTPCHRSNNFEICYYPYNIQEIYPKDNDLKELNIDSYLGTAITDTNNNLIGSIALLHSKTIERPALIEDVLTILSPRLEVELTRLQTNLAPME